MKIRWPWVQARERRESLAAMKKLYEEYELAQFEYLKWYYGEFVNRG